MLSAEIVTLSKYFKARYRIASNSQWSWGALIEGSAGRPSEAGYEEICRRYIRAAEHLVHWAVGGLSVHALGQKARVAPSSTR